MNKHKHNVLMLKQLIFLFLLKILLIFITCCSCNIFPKIFENFGPSFWFYLAWIYLVSWTLVFFSLLQIWIVWSWIEVKCFHAFRKTAFCLPMLLTVDFKVWFENYALLIWMISFIAIRSLFMLSRSFSSLCRCCFGGEVN